MQSVLYCSMYTVEGAKMANGWMASLNLAFNNVAERKHSTAQHSTPSQSASIHTVERQENESPPRRRQWCSRHTCTYLPTYVTAGQPPFLFHCL